MPIPGSMPAPLPTTTVGPVEAFWRYRRRTLPFAVVLAALAVGFALRSSDVTATTAVYLTDPRGSAVFRDAGTPVAELEAYARQRADFAVSQAVLGVVSANLVGTPTTSELRRVVTATFGKGTSIRIACTDDDVAGAEALCAAVAQAYRDLTKADTDRRSTAAVENLQATRAQLVDQLIANEQSPTSSAVESIDIQIAQTKLRADLFGDGVEFIDSADVMQSSRVLAMLQYGIAGLVFGVLIGGALAWVAAVRRPMVTDPEEAAARLGAPLLGTFTGDDAGAGASVELIATNLASRGQSGLVVLTTWDAGVATTDLTRGIGEAWTREGRHMLLVDGAVRQGGLSKALGAGTAGVGFTDLVAGLAVEDAVLRNIQLPNGPRMLFLPCGRAVEHASSLLRSPTAAKAFVRLRQQFDVVLVDAPPIMDRAEGAALASIADGIVIVLPPSTPSKTLDTLRRRIEVLGVPLIGVIVGAAGE